MKPGYYFQDHGTLTMVCCLNAAAFTHLKDHTDDEAQWMGRSLACEPRYAPGLAANLCRDGFTVQLPDGRVVTADDLAEGSDGRLFQPQGRVVTGDDLAED
jgi:hypothetical protein